MHGGADEVFTLLTGLLRLLRIDLAKQVLFIADGADWLWLRVEDLLRDANLDEHKVEMALHYFHACEHIATALSACRFLSQKERRERFTTLKATLLEDQGGEKVISELRTLARGRRAALIQRELRYLNKNVTLLCYSHLCSAHLPIGSGVVESAIRRVVNLRLGSASQCWTPEHSERLLCLRAVCKSGRWDSFFHALLEHRHWLLSSIEPHTQ